MARNQVMRLLSQADKGASGTQQGAGGVLSRLWRIQLKELGINIQRWNDLMYKFVNDPRNDYPANKRDQQSARGNLTKEFSRPRMTWKVYMKAQRFLGVKDLTIAIECNFIDGRRSLHSAPVNFGLPSLPPASANFIQQLVQEPLSLTNIAAAMEFMEDTMNQPIYTELEDDASVRQLIFELCNPFSEPFERPDAKAHDYEPGTEDFGGSYLGKRAYEQYLADIQQ